MLFVYDPFESIQTDICWDVLFKDYEPFSDYISLDRRATHILVYKNSFSSAGEHQIGLHGVASLPFRSIF